MPQMPKFFVSDKVRHKQCPSLVGEVVRVGKEQIWPDKGPVRKIHWASLVEGDNGKLEWTWDFALEAF